MKNEVLCNPKTLNNAEYIGQDSVDLTHNTNKKIKRLKEQTDYFYYFQITLLNKSNVYLHLGGITQRKKGKRE